MRWFKRGLVVALIVGLAFSGRWAIHAGFLYRLYTNAMLIDAYPKNKKATKEISRRIIAKRLNDGQIQTLVDKSFKVDLTIRSPHPRRIRVKYDMTITTQPGGLFKLNVNPATIESSIESKLDGTTVKPNGGATGIDNYGRKQSIELNCPFDEVPSIGNHEFEVHIAAPVGAFDSALDKAMTSRRSIAFEIVKSAPFVVADRSIFEMLKCRDSDADIAYLKDNFRMVVVHRDPNGRIFAACAKSIPPSAYFHVSLKQFEGERVWSSLSGGVSFYTHKRSKFDSIMDDYSNDPIDHAECRWTFDYSHDYNNGAESVYPFALEWTITDFDNLPQYTPNCACKLPYARPPDRIIRLTEVDRPGS